MSTARGDVERGVADMEGSAAMPRSNGELVFQAPWEGRVFAVAVALAEQGLCSWERFRAGLIAEIADWEQAHRSESEADEWDYYERWLANLERLVLRKGLITETELAQRAATLAARDEHVHEHGLEEGSNEP